MTDMHMSRPDVLLFAAQERDEKWMRKLLPNLLPIELDELFRTLAWFQDELRREGVRRATAKYGETHQ